MIREGRDGINRRIEGGTAVAYDEVLADRVRDALAGQREVEEKKMFGGIAFMVRGHMCCGVVKNDLMVRVGPARYEQALAEADAREMDFTGRALKSMVYVGADSLESGARLEHWVRRALDFNATLPAK